MGSVDIVRLRTKSHGVSWFVCVAMRRWLIFTFTVMFHNLPTNIAVITGKQDVSTTLKVWFPCF
jgi:hypothetical protein